jgi:peptide/nickel transport system substrate-binding protein
MEKKTARWWDKLGKPQFGGTINIRFPSNIVNFDPYNEAQLTQIFWAWMESMGGPDWTLDPASFDYKIFLRPNQYRKGQLAESWEFPDPYTFVVHLRKGIHWQDIPPVNGREFTADDVVYHYQRLFGLGSGPKPSPWHATVQAYTNLISVTAADRYTAVFKWKIANPDLVMVSLLGVNPTQVFEAREAVEKWGDLTDWHHAIGTGPFILKDFISGKSATLTKNPNYWGHDERYPQNKLPYVDAVKIHIIPDNKQALAAMRAGEIDIICPVSLQDAQEMGKTNPEIVQIPLPFSMTATIDPRIDKAPFNDIRVRKAMQTAIDLPAIAKDYYHGLVDPYPAMLDSRGLKGLGFPYEEWPQDLKEEYAYNPTAAKKLLADAGYPTGFKTNVVADTAVDLDLLKIVKSYLSQVGIDMEIRLMDSAAWSDFVLLGHKHDQMSQRPLPAAGYAFEPIRLLHGLQTGHPTHQMISDPVCDTLYPRGLAAASAEEAKQIYRDAIEYLARQHYSISLLQPKCFALCQPWFKGYYGQFGSITGSAVLSFDLARFWIDKNLKKS